VLVSKLVVGFLSGWKQWVKTCTGDCTYLFIHLCLVMTMCADRLPQWFITTNTQLS